VYNTINRRGLGQVKRRDFTASSAASSPKAPVFRRSVTAKSSISSPGWITIPVKFWTASPRSVSLCAWPI